MVSNCTSALTYHQEVYGEVIHINSIAYQNLKTRSKLFSIYNPYDKLLSLLLKREMPHTQEDIIM